MQPRISPEDWTWNCHKIHVLERISPKPLKKTNQRLYTILNHLPTKLISTLIQPILLQKSGFIYLSSENSEPDWLGNSPAKSTASSNIHASSLSTGQPPNLIISFPAKTVVYKFTCPGCRNCVIEKRCVTKRINEHATNPNSEIYEHAKSCEHFEYMKTVMELSLDMNTKIECNSTQLILNNCKIIDKVEQWSLFVFKEALAIRRQNPLSWIIRLQETSFHNKSRIGYLTCLFTLISFFNSLTPSSVEIEHALPQGSLLFTAQIRFTSYFLLINIMTTCLQLIVRSQAWILDTIAKPRNKSVKRLSNFLLIA